MKRKPTTPAPAVGAQTETPPSPPGRGDGGEGQTANPDWRYIPGTAETCYLCGKRADYHNNGWLDPAKPGADFHLCKRCMDRHQGTLLGHTDAAQLQAALDGLKSPSPSEGEGRGGGHDWPTPTAPVSVPIPVDLVDPNPEQPRQDFPEAELKELGESILEHGLIQPIVVEPRGDRYILHDGERRLRAHKLVGLEEIPAYIVPPGADAKTLLLRAIVANDQRADLSPIERAKGYQKLADEHSLSDSDIAKQVGKSRSVVANTRRLLQLPEDRQAQVADGTLNERQALALLPLYQLHPKIQEQLSNTWQMREALKDPGKLTSDGIRNRIRESLQYSTKRFSFFPPDQNVGPGGGVRHSLCTDCPFFIKINDENRCAESECYQAKEACWHRALLEEAQKLTGLNFVHPGRDLTHNQKTEFYSYNLPILEHALACQCRNLVLAASNYASSAARPEGVSEYVHYICLHPGKSDKSCTCRQAVESDKTAAEKLHKVQVQQMKDRATATLMAELEKCGLPALKAMAPHVLGYSDRKKIDAATEAAQLAKMIVKFLVDRELWAGDPERTRQYWRDWFAKIGLAVDSPDTAKAHDLDRRLARIEGWIAELPDPAINGNLTKEAIAGNLTNLANMAEELSQINDPALIARFDAAKRTLLARREQAEQRAAYAGELDSIRASLSKFSAWLTKPENHTNQKLLNRGADLADLAYLVNTLITKHGEQPEFTALLTEIETVENLCRGLRRKLSESAAPVEAQPQEAAA